MSNQFSLAIPVSQSTVVSDQIRILEVALLTSQDPLPVSELKKLFDGTINSKQLLAMLVELSNQWQEKGIELVEVASGWRFQSRPEMQIYLEKLNPQKPPRYSHAVLETLAIIAYRQPVTRGDIEEIRGVTVSSAILKTLETRGWIEVVGQRNVPGRPQLYATTSNFLDDLNLQSLEQLPPLDELINQTESITEEMKKVSISDH